MISSEKKSRMWILYVGLGVMERIDVRSDESGKGRICQGQWSTPLTLNPQNSRHSDRKRRANHGIGNGLL